MSRKNLQKHTEAVPVIEKKFGIAPSIKAAANRTGLPERMVRELKRDPGYVTAFHTSGRINCDVLVKLIAEHPGTVEKFSEVPVKEIEDAYRARWTQQQAKHDLDVAQGAYVARDDIRLVWGQLISAAKTQMESSEVAIAREAKIRFKLTDEQASMLQEIILHEHTQALSELHRGKW